MFEILLVTGILATSLDHIPYFCVRDCGSAPLIRTKDNVQASWWLLEPGQHQTQDQSKSTFKMEINTVVS